MDIEAELASLRREVTAIRDRQDVIDCVQRECRARDRQDVDQIASCWWPEGVDEHGPSVNLAPEYPERANKGHSANFEMTSHNITNTIVELAGETAYCESYVIGGLFWLDRKTTTIAFGRYIDQLENRNGEWRLLTRRCTIEMSANTDGTWVHSGAVKGFLKALWNKDDPSYERPVQWRSSDEGIRW